MTDAQETKPSRFNSKDDDIVHLERRLDGRIMAVQADVDRLTLEAGQVAQKVDHSGRYLLIMLGLTALNIGLALFVVFGGWRP